MRCCWVCYSYIQKYVMNSGLADVAGLKNSSFLDDRFRAKQIILNRWQTNIKRCEMIRLFPLLAVLVSGSAYAADKYMVLDYMFLDMVRTANSVSADASPDAIQARAGKVIYDFVALEAAMALGVTGSPFMANVKGKLNSLLSLNAIGRLPVVEDVEVYGRLGIARMDIEVTQAGVSNSYDDAGVLFGLGLSMNLDPERSISIEYVLLPQVDIAGGKVETTSINLGYRRWF